ncbi:hypothetical protein [Kitasatospora sp. NBC_01250]|uniref:hypothetical protein n=1 Tax=Kitasatospora sp. NBC_01250 TaxID=2903571 RepID=UPI003FA55D69
MLAVPAAVVPDAAEEYGVAGVRTLVVLAAGLDACRARQLNTDLALLHLESFGNPRVFSRTARRVTRRLPVLTVDAGRSAAALRELLPDGAAVSSPVDTIAAVDPMNSPAV